MTLDLAAIRARADAATPGPWWPRHGGDPGYVYSSTANREIADLHWRHGDAERCLDADFIAAAREDVPALLAEIERLQAIIKAGDGGPHIIEFTDQDWTIQHPLSCRPNLFDCPFNNATRNTIPMPGRWECTLDEDGWLQFGDRVGLVD